MKFLASTLLVLFITFLSAPIVVMLIEKSADISLIYDLSEKENQKENKENKENKEIKADFTFKNHIEFIAFNFNYSKKIISENVLKHDLISEEIFIPPPELV
ncbi:hypothetical protein [Flavobacterium sp.]|uniref:hypothetical protein n=1 Tax=Flavobacterium sp. TaxID=239 RepID=UPI003753B548